MIDPHGYSSSCKSIQIISKKKASKRQHPFNCRQTNVTNIVTNKLHIVKSMRPQQAIIAFLPVLPLFPILPLVPIQPPLPPIPPHTHISLPKLIANTPKMAWTCSASSNTALIDNLIRKGLVTTPRAIQAMRAVDRKTFIPASGAPYADSPQPIPCSATISAPHMHATAIQLLEPYLTPGSSALDVGAGSGYFTALMAVLVGPTGTVVGIEHAPQLTAMASSNLRKFDASLVQSAVEMRTGDGRLGASDKAPFSAIHVGAASPTVPEPLLEQLSNNGAMIIPVGPEYGAQNLIMVTKDENGKVSKHYICGVRYVPLTDLQRQLHP